MCWNETNIHYCAFHGSHENSNCLRGGVGVAVPLVRNASAKKKAEERDNSEFVTSNGHFLIISRYFIFFCSPVASPRRRVSWKLKIPSINLCIIILREIIFFFFSTFRIPCIGKIKFSFELNETNNNNKKELKIQGEFKSWLRRWGRCCVPTHALEIWFLLRV